MARTLLLRIVCCLTIIFGASAAHAAVQHVPRDFATIQEAIDAASDGDLILVRPGTYCGATVTKPLKLRGLGRPVIVGCDGGPTVTTDTRVGFFLPGSAGVNPASGTSIQGFVFDGNGISNTNLEPLAFGIFARFANDIRVQSNRFEGTVQAITNTAGDRWLIKGNTITDLSLFDCTVRCSGGDGIVIAVAAGSTAAPGGTEEPLNRPEDNLVVGNRIDGTPPDGFSAFSMAGILLLAADRTTLLRNVVSLSDNPDAESVGQGILVDNTCCGLATSFLPGARGTVIAFNDGRLSEVAIVIAGSGGANTEGLFLFKNLGTVVIEGVTQEAAQARAARPQSAPELRSHCTT